MPTHASNSATVLSGKFKNLHHGLKVWRKLVSKLEMLIDNSNTVLLQLDSLEENRPLTIPEGNFHSILTAHVMHFLKYRNLYRKKLYTYRWVVHGDENTKFFQAHATERYKRNIFPLPTLPDGRTITSCDEKAVAFLQAFKGDTSPTYL